MTKLCAACNQEKETAAFRYKDKEKGWLQPYCIECNKEYQRKHYQNNKKLYYTKARAWEKEYRKSIYTWLSDYFRENPCVDCGENHIAVCDFDHVRGTKEYGISNMVRDKMARHDIEKEIEKCEVRCSNCHRKKTAKDFGWYQGVFD